MVYEIKWDCDPEELEGKQRDFLIVRRLSDWLTELTVANVDDLSMVEREWWILHVTPGHLMVFLHLCAKDLTPRIQCPLKEPYSWSSKPLHHPRVQWTEELYFDYWAFLVRLNEVRNKPLYSLTSVKTKWTLTKWTFEPSEHFFWVNIILSGFVGFFAFCHCQ